MDRLLKRITALILTMAVFCMIGCKKADEPNNGGNNGNNGGNGGETPEAPAIVSTSEVQYDGKVFVEAEFEDETKMYFALLSPTEAEVVRGESFYQDNPGQVYKYRGEVFVPESVTHLGTSYSVVAIAYKAFNDCDLITSVHLPKTVTSVDRCAFLGCHNLTGIKGDSVRSFGSWALYDCESLTDVFLPSTTNRIDDLAFALFFETINPNVITTITCMALNPPELGNNVYSGRFIQTIRVPISSVEAYKTAEGWSQYADVIVGI